MRKLFTILTVLLLVGAGCSTLEPTDTVGVATPVDTSRSITKWEEGDAPVYLSINYPLEDAEVLVGASDGAEMNEIIYTSKDKDVITYDLSVSKEYPQGGFEYEAVLKTAPKTNIVEFDLKGKNLVFFKQKALDVEQAEGKIDANLTCTKYECRNEEGVLVDSRPENIVDSYAVFHTSKKNYRAGGINYGNGKAFHIYRSKIFNSDEEWVWAEDMTIEAGKIKITIPQDFIDQTVNAGLLPLIVDPTLGYTTNPGSNSTQSPDEIRHFDINDGAGITMSEDGTATTTYWWMGDSSGVDNAKAAIYDEASGTPDGLVDEGNEIAGASLPSTRQWVAYTGLTACLSNGSVYYSATWVDHAFNTVLVGYDTTDGDDGYFVDSEAYGTWPDPTAEGARSQGFRTYGIYIGYDSGCGGGGGATPAPKTGDIIIF